LGVVGKHSTPPKSGGEASGRENRRLVEGELEAYKRPDESIGELTISSSASPNHPVHIDSPTDT